MDMSHSIASARNHLPQLVHEAEVGNAVQITRRGKPVAVIVGLAEYERLNIRVGASHAYQAWRADWKDDLQDPPFDEVRDKSPGRIPDL